MGKTTIEWCDFTFNPWWGCTRVSPGCENCYAETWAKRFGVKWGANEARRTFGAKHWAEPLKWERSATKFVAQHGRRARVFCASMADVFDKDGPEHDRVLLWELIQKTPSLDWLLLTKRPQNWAEMLPFGPAHPWSNVWLGITVEDQKRADERMPLLVAQSARRKFVSYEPALGPVNLESWAAQFDWVITGAESGSGARPMQEEWARSMRDWCAKTGTYFFYKQKVEGGRKVSLPMLDGVVHAEFPR